MLEIKNLWVGVDNRIILRDINLKIKKSEIHALMGPNASGKTTLAKTIIGFPGFNIIKGKILFNGKDITNLEMEKRIKLGISLAFQNPPAIPGIRVKTLLKTINKNWEEIIKELKDPIIENFLDREINVDFSGGERKYLELIQVLCQKPKFVIFDEIDSGIDIERVKGIGKIIKNLFRKSSILLITHSGAILDVVRPDKIHVMINGEIVCSSSSWKKVLRTIRSYGYEKCKKCKLRPDK